MSLNLSRPADGVSEAASEGSPRSEGDGASASLHPDLWRAMVSETEGVRWYMDLEALSILRAGVADGEAAALEARPGGRFLPIPTISTERQRNHARHVLAEHLEPADVDWLTGGQPWLRHFHESASPELRQLLSDARRAWVVTEVLTWIRDHNLPEHRFVRAARPSARDARDARPARGRSLRQAIHRAIDRMTDRELDALPIPARLLVDD